MYFTALALLLALAPLSLAAPMTSGHSTSIRGRVADTLDGSYAMPEEDYAHNGTYHHPDGDPPHTSKSPTPFPDDGYTPGGAGGEVAHTRHNGTHYHNGTYHNNKTGHYDHEDPMRRWQSAATRLDYSDEAMKRRQPAPEAEDSLRPEAFDASTPEEDPTTSDFTVRSKPSRPESRKPLSLRALTDEGSLLEEEASF
jgi:hypothetical protein